MSQLLILECEDPHESYWTVRIFHAYLTTFLANMDCITWRDRE